MAVSVYETGKKKRVAKVRDVTARRIDPRPNVRNASILDTDHSVGDRWRGHWKYVLRAIADHVRDALERER